jgi:hypothetical protein
MNKRLPDTQEIGWNGLHLSIPSTWDTIVRDHRHLIFEQDLRPVLELRWEPPASPRQCRKRSDRIIAQLQKEASRPLVPLDAPPSLGSLKERYHIKIFGHSNSATSECALLACRGCGALMLMKFYPQFYHPVMTDQTILDSLVCWHGENSNSNWAVHDITFRLPEQFSLNSHSFKFGLSSLLFSDKKTKLRLCRLAPASEHLKRNSFKELFASFSRSGPEHQVVIDENTLQFSKIPGITERIIARLRRRKPYVLARFNHVTGYDRIIGFMFESSRPIQPDMVQALQEHYGIIQEKETGCHDHS